MTTPTFPKSAPTRDVLAIAAAGVYIFAGRHNVAHMTGECWVEWALRLDGVGASVTSIVAGVSLNAHGEWVAAVDG